MSAWEEKVQPRLKEIQEWFMNGWSFRAIANALEISVPTFWSMRKKYKELEELTTYGEKCTHDVENSLYMRCIGYTQKITRWMKVKVTYIDEKGNKCSKEEMKSYPDEIYIPPDVQAQKFWLLNHAPTRYRSEQPEINITNELLDHSDEVLIKVKEIAEQIRRENE